MTHVHTDRTTLWTRDLFSVPLAQNLYSSRHSTDSPSLPSVPLMKDLLFLCGEMKQIQKYETNRGSPLSGLKTELLIIKY